MRENKTSTNVS